MALTDSLTGLLNRRAFDDILDREMRRAHSNGSQLGLILADLDHFKEVNDRHGHNAGDEVLRNVSATLRQLTRPADSLARYGGEEFALLVRGTTSHELGEIAERLREAISRCSAVPDGLGITLSAGAALSLENESMSAFVERCDRALYASKHAGRNAVTLCTSTMQSGMSSTSREGLPGMM
jgi:diguanylate cyclase (GGDEF)-like protein